MDNLIKILLYCLGIAGLLVLAYWAFIFIAAIIFLILIFYIIGNKKKDNNNKPLI